MRKKEEEDLPGQNTNQQQIMKDIDVEDKD